VRVLSPQAIPVANTVALSCHLGFVDNCEASVGVGISTVIVDLLSLIAGGNALISKETNLQESPIK
jgi:hypothetical protein